MIHMKKNNKENSKDSNHKEIIPENQQLEKKNGEDSAENKEEQDYGQIWDKYVRLQAEFDNYRKRSFKEKTEFIKFANEGLILELLEILDNFERGIKSAELKKDFDLLHQGVDMISRQLHALLEAKGLKKIKCLGEKFDPHKHEAVEVIEAEGTGQDTITEELQAGYVFNDRIIRPARVKVTKDKVSEPDIKVKEEEKKEKSGEETKD
ncbi:MAG: nucleotide exchange factor GrpE [Candidatus Omnitrophica bacterium]|nr:nucleotide exchange factor GrpE [Candidatus Omnitrophota bacterium]